MAKVIQITVQVLNVDEDDKWQADQDFEPEYLTISYEDEDAEMVYAEAGELALCIEKLLSW